MMKSPIAALRHLLPKPFRRRLVGLTRWPPVGLVRFGSFRRLTPISDAWGGDRGQPIDRFYVERFLGAHAQDVRGAVLEIGDNTYTRCFGGDRVTRSEVLGVTEHEPSVTLIGDLTRADHLATGSFDCVILTQTLQFIFDVASAVQTVQRILRPGGVALATVPGISKVSRHEMARWGCYWNFTSASARRLFETAFPASDVAVTAHGNVLASVAFLHGLAAHELQPHELDHLDHEYELLITIRAVKPGIAE
jgi:SAM-dependent methyltransferase